MNLWWFFFLFPFWVVSQPGTLEYDFAKQWRALYRRHRQQVERLQEEQREELQKEVNRIWQNHS